MDACVHAHLEAEHERLKRIDGGERAVGGGANDTKEDTGAEDAL